MFFNSKTGEYELDLVDRMKKYIGVEVRKPEGELGKIVDAYSCYDGEFFIVQFNKSETIHMRDDVPIIRNAIKAALLNFENYSCILVRHSENYGIMGSTNMLKDDVLIYDKNINLITTVSKITGVNDWFASNIYQKKDDILLIDTFYGSLFSIDMKNLRLIEKVITK